MSKPSSDAAVAAVVASLTIEERGALPARLRAMVADERTLAWQEAKGARDAEREAAWGIEDVEERATALTTAKERWSAFKAAFAASED